MPNQFDVHVRIGTTQKQAIVFVHGFSGDSPSIWAARLLKSSEAESRLQKLLEAGPR